MRISIVGYSRRKIGGTEQNLDVVIPELERRGHQVQFVYLHDEPATRAPVRTGASTSLVDVGQLGESVSLARIRGFHPDIINVHGEIDPDFQEELIAIAPSAYSVHNYYGTCISGLKTHKFPVISPCKHTFGPACLLRYFPQRCGGLNPITMVRRYQTERARLDVMSRYDAIITHSSHMEAEYLKHGLQPSQIHGLPYEVAAKVFEGPQLERSPLENGVGLLFVGRMEELKGGQVLLAALPRVRAALQRPVQLHFAGDGPRRAQWTNLAASLTAADPGLEIFFHGWVTGPELHQLFAAAHLLVVPSLWPEPFGKVGPEAAGYGIPVAAFAVGGVEEWLVDGVNGIAAFGDPPSAESLASAITDCLINPNIYVNLCQGALKSVDRFHLDSHVNHLVNLFEEVSRARVSGLEPALAE